MLFSQDAGRLTGIALAPFFSWGVWHEVKSVAIINVVNKKKDRSERSSEISFDALEHFIKFHF